MSILDRALRELKDRRRDINKEITGLEAEIQDRDEKTARIKEQRELIEKLMSARTAPIETPTKAPTKSLHYRLGVDMATNPSLTELIDNPYVDRQTDLKKMQGVKYELLKREPQEPEPQRHDRFGAFKYVKGEMVRDYKCNLCKCELCKKRGIANG